MGLPGTGACHGRFGRRIGLEPGNQAGYPHDRPIEGEGQALGEGHGHAKAGERSRAGAHANAVQVAQRSALPSDHLQQPGQQLGRLALRQRPGLRGQQGPIGFGNGQSEVRARGVDGDDHEVSVPSSANAAAASLS